MPLGSCREFCPDILWAGLRCGSVSQITCLWHKSTLIHQTRISFQRSRAWTDFVSRTKNKVIGEWWTPLCHPSLVSISCWMRVTERVVPSFLEWTQLLQAFLASVHVIALRAMSICSPRSLPSPKMHLLLWTNLLHWAAHSWEKHSAYKISWW